MMVFFMNILHPQDHPTYSQDPVREPENRLTIDLTFLKKLVDRRDFETILKSQDLFFAQFCKTFVEKKDLSDLTLNAKIDQNHIFLASGINKNPPIIKVFKQEIERMRLIAQAAFETRSEVNRIILPIDTGTTQFLKSPSSKIVDLSQVYDKDKIGDVFFPFVQPYLRDFFNSLKMDYFESSTTQLAQFHPCLEPKVVNATTIQIIPKKKQYHTYPIQPAIVPPFHVPDKAFYDQFHLGRFCDYTIRSLDSKQEVKVHGVIFYIYGGSYFQTLFSRNMKETVDKVIEMDYPLEVINTVVKSIYLGPKYLEQEWLNGNEHFNVYEILKFAHFYELHSLFKHMVNLLICSCDPSQRQIIKDLAEHYQDPDLKRLAHHLKGKIDSHSKG